MTSEMMETNKLVLTRYRPVKIRFLDVCYRYLHA
jgi:hypothetical protein